MLPTTVDMRKNPKSGTYDNYYALRNAKHYATYVCVVRADTGVCDSGAAVECCSSQRPAMWVQLSK